MRRRFSANTTQNKNYLRFYAEEDSLISISLPQQLVKSPDIQYRIDNEGGWVKYYFTEKISLKRGQTLYMKGNNPNGLYGDYDFDSYASFIHFEIEGSLSASGNIMSILYNDNFEKKYSLPTSRCFTHLFEDCVGLTKAPELPATTLTENCYSHMFYGCSNLNYIKMLATDIPDAYCLSNWVYGVSSTGTFVKHPDMTSLTTGVNGIPEGWTVVNDGEEGEGGNDFGIEFPLYLEFDYCEDGFMGKICTRTSDVISVNLYNYLTRNAIKYGEFSEGDGGSYILNEQVLDMLGAEIYIENAKVIEFAFGEYLRPVLYTEDEYYRHIYLDSDGLLEFVEGE